MVLALVLCWPARANTEEVQRSFVLLQQHMEEVCRVSLSPKPRLLNVGETLSTNTNVCLDLTVVLQGKQLLESSARCPYMGHKIFVAMEAMLSLTWGGKGTANMDGSCQLHHWCW